MTLKVRAAEPAVTAEPSVEPAFLPERDAWRFCVTPKEIYRWLEPQLSTPSAARQLEFDVNCTNSAESCQVATLQTAYTVRVRELRYPGRPADSVDAAGKWVYVFRDGKLVVEAHCIKGDLWDGWTVAGASRQPWRSAMGLRLDPGPSGHRFTYSYMLSPLKLCREVIEDIESGKLKLGAVESACDCYDKHVLLPDPLRWACDVQEQYYQPRLRTLQTWKFDEGLVAYEFVARVLKAWIDSGDKVKAKNELQRTPESWLDERAAGVARAGREADEAAAYLAHCVAAPEYVAVERSGGIRGGEDLELVAVCLATATTDILQTQPGRRLALDLVADPQRLPRQLLFQDDGPKLPDEWFARYRYGQRALFGIFRELVPASIELALLRAKEAVELEKAQRASSPAQKTSRFDDSAALKKRAQKYLENLGAKTKLSKRRARILENLRKNKPVATGTRKKSEQWARMMTEWEELTELEEVKHAPKVPTKVERLEHLAKRYEPYQKFAKGLTATLGTVVEIINLTIAIEELRKAREAGAEDLSKKKWSAAGAVADMVEHGSGMAGWLFEGGLKELKTTKLKLLAGGVRFVGAVGGIAGGVIDMLDYEEQTFAAAEEYDYGKLAGRSMQLAGAAGVTAGSAMALAWIVVEACEWGASLGALGALVGAVGGALVAGGFLVAQWLSLNANQVFAGRSFLGIHSHEVGADVSWSRDPLPSQDAKAEASVLVDLLSQFQLTAFADLGDWRVFIHPCYLEDGSMFEVQVANRWTNAHPENYSLVVDLDQDEVRQTAGPPLKAGEVKRDDASGQVEYILINTEAAQPRVNPLREHRDTSVRVRLMHYEEGKKPAQRAPKQGDSAVEIRLPSSSPIFSLDPSTWVQADSAPKEPK